MSPVALGGGCSGFNVSPEVCIQHILLEHSLSIEEGPVYGYRMPHDFHDEPDKWGYLT